MIIGSGTLPIRCAEILVERGHELCALVSSEAKAAKWARDRSVPVYRSSRELLVDGPAAIDHLFSIVNMEILREDVLELPLRSAINYHDAPLPRYAGTHATSWALLNHERRHAITWHLATDVVDAGDILKQIHVEIADDETAHSLNTKCYEAAARGFAELLDDLANGTARPEKQDLSKRTFFPRFRRPANGGVISWESTAEEISALVRSLDFGPHPNPLGIAKIAIDDTYLLVSEVESSEIDAVSPPGTVNEIGTDYLRVSTLTKELVLRRVLSLDGEPLNAADLAARFDVQAGYRFQDAEKGKRDRIASCFDATSRSESYWVGKLAQAMPAVPPFTDASKTAGLSGYATIPFTVPAEFVDLVGRSRGSHSPALNLIAAFGGFHSRLNDTGSFDFGYCDDSVYRQHTETGGLFAEAVPLRFEIDGRQNFADLLESADAEFETVRRHGTFSRDISARYPELSSRTGFPVNIVLADANANQRSSINGDIALVVSDDGWDCHLIYDRNRLESADVERMLGYFATFLRGIANGIDSELATIPILPDDERDLLLYRVHGPRIEVPDGRCIHHLFEAQVEATPDHVALVVDDQQIAYRELDKRAERVADRLRTLGVGPGVLVAICAARSAELIAGILGILKAGGAYVPLDPAYPQARLSQILTDSRAPFLLTQANVAQKLGTYDGRVVFLGRDEDDVTIDQSSVGEISKVAEASDLAYVIYTSGSTGKPKGVAIEHRNAVTFLEWAKSVFGADRLRRTVASTSICFDLSIFEIFAPLSCGGTVILVENILHLPKAPAAATATLINTVPSAIAELLKIDGVPSSVSTVNLAGEPLKTTLVKQIYDTGSVQEVFDLYGPTEDTTYSTFTLRDGGRATIGRPIANTRAYILDRNLQPVPQGVPGELYLGGDGLARGYLNQPDLTAERFLSNPFDDDPKERIYRTGDLVRYTPSFEIEYLGRIDNQVKIRGFRIELGEIESVLTAHPAIEEAVVVARSDQPGEKKLVAYVVSRGGTRLGTRDLREHINRVLPDFMVPSMFVELDELPLTPNGKIDRKALPVPSYAVNEVDRNYVAPRDEFESRLVRIWERLLNVSPVGVTDNFFELGGDSLISVSLFVEIENEFGVDFPLSALINSPTIEMLAAQLGNGPRTDSRKYLVPLQTEGTRPPLFCMHAAGGNVLFYMDLATELGTDQPFYGLQARGVADKSETAHDRVEEMTADYLKEIRAVQPTGPYHLCGASFGGLIAFEAARQLVAAGETVGTLALFDTYAPRSVLANLATSSPSRLSSLVNRARSIESQLREIKDWKSRVGFVRSKVTKLRKQVKRKIAWTRNQFAIEYNKATGRELPPNMMRNHAAIQKAMDDYLPEIYDGNMLLFRASEQPVSAFDQNLGWGAFVNGKITAVVVKGTHGALTVYPFAKDLAAKLKPLLEEGMSSGAQSRARHNRAA